MSYLRISKLVGELGKERKREREREKSTFSMIVMFFFHFLISEVGARNERHLAVVFYNKLAGFEIVHGILDRLMQVLEVPWGTGYRLVRNDDATFMPGRCALIITNGKPIGHVGVLHPDVIKAFELNLPCCALEINIEPFV